MKIKTQNKNPNFTIVLPGTCQAKCDFCFWKEDSKIRVDNPEANRSERLRVERHEVAKYHKKKGMKIRFGCDGWTEEGKQYFWQIKKEVDAMKKDECFWDTITKQWKVYCEKHMIVKYVDRVDKAIDEMK